jgi:hypothetical protein
MSDNDILMIPTNRPRRARAYCRSRQRRTRTRRSVMSPSHLASQSRESVADRRGSRLAQADLQISQAKIEEAWTLWLPQANKGPASKFPKTDMSCLRPSLQPSSDVLSEILPVLIIQDQWQTHIHPASLELHGSPAVAELPRHTRHQLAPKWVVFHSSPKGAIHVGDEKSGFVDPD